MKYPDTQYALNKKHPNSHANELKGPSHFGGSEWWLETGLEPFLTFSNLFPTFCVLNNHFSAFPAFLCDQEILNMFNISAFQTATCYNLHLLWSCPSVALLCLVRIINFGDSALYHFYANTLSICTIFYA